ncbi:MAG TPA: hypothetical protein VEY95_09520 [Azospirillaceae bacterium]|nr:hypothetical protein [Azospirillaceae bacterium]
MLDYKFDRNMREATIRKLFALSGNRCACPACPNLIVASATLFDPNAVIGHIAHIYSVTSKGPRPHPDQPSEAFINGFGNLLLLCRHHHGLIDAQPNSFPAEMLLGWKLRQMPRVTGTREAFLSESVSVGRIEFTTVNATVLQVDAPEERIERERRLFDVRNVRHRYQTYWLEHGDGSERQEILRDVEPVAREGQPISMLTMIRGNKVVPYIAGIYNHTTGAWFELIRLKEVLNWVYIREHMLAVMSFLVFWIMAQIAASHMEWRTGGKIIMFGGVVAVLLFLAYNMLLSVRLWCAFRRAKTLLQIR